MIETELKEKPRPLMAVYHFNVNVLEQPLGKNYKFVPEDFRILAQMPDLDDLTPNCGLKRLAEGLVDDQTIRHAQNRIFTGPNMFDSDYHKDSFGYLFLLQLAKEVKENGSIPIMKRERDGYEDKVDVLSEKEPQTGRQNKVCFKNTARKQRNIRRIWLLFTDIIW